MKFVLLSLALKIFNCHTAGNKLPNATSILYEHIHPPISINIEFHNLKQEWTLIIEWCLLSPDLEGIYTVHNLTYYFSISMTDIWLWEADKIISVRK